MVVPGHAARATRRAAYAADITYGTNNEFGFDYLRDNMALREGRPLPARPELRHRRRSRLHPDRRGAHAADHLRPGRRIAGALRQGQPHRAASWSSQEKEDGDGDYWVDEKGKQVHLSEAGMEHAEQLLREAGILGRRRQPVRRAATWRVVHHLNAALRAHALYQRDVDYIVRDGEVIIVDEFTGRTLPGRRWSDGLHQAVEAKEGVPIQRENQTLASITFQNYFRMYKKLAGMTGTADTEAYEFQSIYGLEVVVIPTHRPMVRKDYAGPGVPQPRRPSTTRSSRTSRTATSAASRCWSAPPRSKPPSCCPTQLRKAGIPHEVLNAKQHEREAQIVAQAGRPGAVTIATNMAGRGTDIVLGGNPGSRAARAAAKTPTEADRASVKAEWQERHDAGAGRRRPAHHRHRAPRIAPHRQPAARPFRPPGRPGFLALLPVARRQPDAHLRRRLGAEARCDGWA